MKKNRKNIWLNNFDYSSDGAYFFTICTKNKEHFFGEIKNGVMCVNTVGKIAWKCWKKIPEHFPNVKLQEFIVMPNHIHGVLWIQSKETGNAERDYHHSKDEKCRGRISSPHRENNIKNVVLEKQNIKRNENIRPLHSPMSDAKSEFLSSIIREFKMSVTKYCNQKNISFTWQKSFYNRIIRNKKELETFCKYTKYSPVNWEKDEENIFPKKNIFLALGSNVGDRKKMLEAAVNEIKKIATIKKYSHIWESAPWGETDQEAFLNAVIEIETKKNPYIFLEEIQNIEKKIGRKKRYKWGPREIDIDILFWGNETVGTRFIAPKEIDTINRVPIENVIIPHPFWQKRDFVIFPMADIAPDFLPPKSTNTIHEWKDMFPHTEIRKYGDFFKDMK